MNLDRNNLHLLTQLKTPVYLEDEQTCHDYSQLRGSAQNLLTNPDDERSREKLSSLMTKLGLDKILR